VQGVAAGLANPYYARMATSATASVMGDVMAQSPTFFSLWIGANDVLGYATSGGTGEDHNMTGNLDAATYAGNDITHAGVFAQVYGGLLQTLTSGGAEGIVANLPNVADAPFFTTVPHAPLDPTNPDFAPQIPALNAQFGQLNQVFAALGVPERSIEFSTTAASAVVIKDESLTDLSAQITGALMAGGADAGTATILGLLYGQARQATADDLILLTASGAIATVDTDNVAYLMGLGLDQATAGQLSVTGLTLPMGDGMVLIPDEQTAISNAITAYNQTISNAATTFDLAFFDVNAFFTEVATNGYQAGSAFMTADLVTGGTFSLDGIHPSPRGNAVIANQMINAINAKYGSNLPTVNPVDYTGVYLD
ncbi:MAG: G-D-S-L family lipolytic protein, partial [Flavobacteriaceae bacterium]